MADACPHPAPTDALVPANERFWSEPARLGNAGFSLREAASQAQAWHGRPLELSRVWQKLAAGQLRIADSFSSADECALVLKHASGQRRRASVRRASILERFLVEADPKVMASDLSLSVSTVAEIAKACLVHFGLTCTLAKAPALLFLAARAARIGGPRHIGRAATFLHAGHPHHVITVRRPELALAAALTHAEYEVSRLVVDGKSHREIARERQTTVRTVANQASTLFRRLGVSGRSGLLRWLAALPLLEPLPLDVQSFASSSNAPPNSS